jgi:hypothetical protein
VSKSSDDLITRQIGSRAGRCAARVPSAIAADIQEIYHRGKAAKGQPSNNPA